MKKDEKKITIILVIITVLFSLYRVYSTLTPTNYADYRKRISLQVDADFNYEPIDNIESSDTYICRFTLKKPVELKNFISLDQFKQSKRKDIEKFYQSVYKRLCEKPTPLGVRWIEKKKKSVCRYRKRTHIMI